MLRRTTRSHRIHPIGQQRTSLTRSVEGAARIYATAISCHPLLGSVRLVDKPARTNHYEGRRQVGWDLDLTRELTPCFGSKILSGSFLKTLKNPICSLHTHYEVLAIVNLTPPALARFIRLGEEREFLANSHLD